MKRPYRGGVPAPPAEIAAEMADAGREPRDDVRIGLLQAQYEDWLEAQGYEIPNRGRPPRADEAAR